MPKKLKKKLIIIWNIVIKNYPESATKMNIENQNESYCDYESNYQITSNITGASVAIFFYTVSRYEKIFFKIYFLVRF